MEKPFWAFPGQGTQRVGMGRELVERFPEAAAAFDEASSGLDLDLRHLLWRSTPEELTRTEHAQMAITLVSIAALRTWQSQARDARTVSWVTGHSVGVLAAAVACGALSFVDGMKLARTRGQLMASAPGTGAMMAVAVTSPESLRLAAEAAQENDLEVSCYNGPRQLVISGTEDAIECARRALGARSQILPVGHAFHSRLMDAILPAWSEELARTVIADPVRPYLSSRTGQFCETSADVGQDLYAALREPVRWDLVTAQAAKCPSGLVFGPGRSLLRMWKGTGVSRNVSVVDDSYRGEAREA